MMAQAFSCCTIAPCIKCLRGSMTVIGLDKLEFNDRAGMMYLIKVHKITVASYSDVHLPETTIKTHLES